MIGISPRKWLADWEKVLASYLADRKALQRKAVAILEEKTGYKVGDYRDKFAPPFLCSYTAGHLLYKSALDSVLKHAAAITWKTALLPIPCQVR